MSLPSGSCFWIFCKVIDNFGDIGVCWRLSRQLHTEYHINVCLWIDDLVSFAKICPEVDPSVPKQTISGVSIYLWQPGDDCLPDSTNTPHVLIESFACELSLPLQHWADAHPVHWINLEYLSAEDWVEQMHLLSSPRPSGQKKQFFFPGFTEHTGGLLQEHNLNQQRQDFLANTTTQQNFRDQLQLPQYENEATNLFIFSYTTPALSDWITCWQNLSIPLHIWLTPGHSTHCLKHLFPTIPKPGTSINMGSLSISILPMVAQQDFDKILWLADINIVRGEDSLVRAHWAHKPFFWHIYPQENDTHLVKLEAFWQKVYLSFSPAIQEAHRALNLELNQAVRLSTKQRHHHWQQLFEHQHLWQQEQKKWTEKQNIMQNLAEKLVNLTQNSLK